MAVGDPGAPADRRWMLRALRLASLCLGTTWPNPGVGCVLVRDGRVIGEGRTAPRDPAHAIQEHGEAAALRDAAARGEPTAGATAYVTLAPCVKRSHGGTDHACTTALRRAGLARVVVALADPSQDDAGEALRSAGATYETGVCERLARKIHGGFLRRVGAKRPRFTGKWAMTLDGCLAARTGASSWISSAGALALSRRRRRAFDAIMIGSGTARADDPRLLASAPRLRGTEHSPLRIVVGGPAALADDGQLLTSLDRAPLLLVHPPDAPAAELSRLRAWGVQLHALEEHHDVHRLAALLGGLGLNDVLVEGGATLHGQFLRAGLYDRLEVYHGATTLGGGMPVARGDGAPTIPDGQRWKPEDGGVRVLEGTVLTRWTRE